MFFATGPAAQPRLPFYKSVLGVTVVLILIVNGLSLFHNLQSLKGANSLLTQSARVGDRLQYLNVLVIDTESSMRGYFISGSELYLGASRTAPVEIDREFKELELLLADNPSQLKNLAQLRTLVNRKLSTMNQAIEVYRHGGLDEIVTIARLSDERSVMDEIRLLIVIMVQEQTETLAARSAAFYQEYQKAVLLGIGINAVAILVLAMFYRLIRSSFFTRIAVERALQDANENLESTVSRRTEQLSVLSRHLIRVSEEEKARLARELHDEMGANLTALSMDISAVMEKLKLEQPELARTLQRARATLLDTVELKRRIVENLRPSMLDNLGLAAAVQSYCDEFSSMSGVRCVTEIDPETDAVTATHAIAVFRIVQESLNNIAKYAHASVVTVRLKRGPASLSLQVIDDGIGIAADALAKPKSHGLLGMRERALLLGGSLRIRRGAGDKGTCIDALIPLAVPVPPAGGAGGGDGSSSETRPAADGHTPSLPLYSTRPHTAPDLDGQLR